MQKQFKNGNAYLLIALIMMAILFYSSSQTYEQQNAIPILQKLLKNEPLKSNLSRISFEYGGAEVSIKASGYHKFIEFFIRKAAHFITYFILGGSFFLGINPRLKHLGIAFLFSWLSATGYAALDEFHQMLTGGRSPMFQDVILDSLGALTACLLISILFLWKNLPKTKNRRN